MLEALPRGRSVYFVGDDREGPVQRSALATEIGRLLPEFGRVDYRNWESLLLRFWREAPAGATLALDEFPSLVSAAPELPSLLQKLVDGRTAGVHLVLAGSSQRMMQGLVLDRRAPLYGRAAEIMRIRPLPFGWLPHALRRRDPAEAVEWFAVWGGVPRYWEMAAAHRRLGPALRALVLSPLAPLHDEPATLLLDDLRDTTQAASILSLVGAGCHRLSEIAGRLQKPVTSLSRPIQRLVDLGLVEREVPWGESPRDSKRAIYRIRDPFLLFWFRFVEPNRSRLEARQTERVAHEVQRDLPQHVGEVWEELARQSVAGGRILGRRWRPARRWWGAGTDRAPMEIDVVAESDDGKALLLGEARWSGRESAAALAEQLRAKAARFPLAGKRAIALAVWLRVPGAGAKDVAVLGPGDVARLLR